jgi:hypothetical protein
LPFPHFAGVAPLAIISEADRSVSVLRSTVANVPSRRKNRLYLGLSLLGLCAVCEIDAASTPGAQGSADVSSERLFDGTFRGWVSYSAEKDAKRDDTWRVEPAKNPDDAVLVCSGRPFGYLRTDQQFDNFELSLEWRYMTDPNSNSGVLIYTAGPDAIWPRGIQVQLHRPEVGSVFPEGGAVSDNVVRARVADLSLQEWHLCRVTSRLGRLTVAIDGHKPVEITGCRPSKGWIGLQSEGSEIHFRRIHVRRLR